jgi:hypothetical protein
MNTFYRWGYLVVCVMFFHSACVERKFDAGTTPIATKDTDQSAIQSTIHGFFRWYEKEDAILSTFAYVDESGPYRKLNHVALQQYFDHLLKSGFVSQQLLDAERKFYLSCEAYWKTDPQNEPPACLAIDRFYCALDYIAPYYSGEVKSIIDGNEAVASLTLTGAMGEQRIVVYKLTKESDKWLLSGLGCDMHTH